MNDSIVQVVESLKTKVSELNFNNWIKPASFSSPSPGILKIAVPNKFIRDWISENYLNLIKYELFKITNLEHNVVFEILPDQTDSPSHTEIKKVVAPSVETNVVHSELFNSKYTFENFVVGSGNQFAHAAAMAVADAPAKTYNPLFIYGGVGLGKTHILSAIGYSILKRNPSARIIYISGESFTNELINSIRYEKMFEFRKKFRDSCDVFLVDDVQFIAGKERTQEEFFHTFNYLFESRKQVVLTSDRVPRDILQLEERLRSRFEWGLIADIQAPDIETRVAILKKKAEDDHILLPDDVAMFLASNVRSNVRELEGSLIRISAFSSLTGAEISIEMAKEVLKNILPEVSKNISVEAIQKLVADHYNIKISELKSSRRLKTLTGPRQIAMYLCRKHAKSSFPELGMKFGGKDHSTVVHAVQKVEKKLHDDPTFKREVDSIEKILLV
ncbi:MAG: chromosomal replication initiator protein DnaA [Deltaproteobacteria bacterium]|nr:chromosomal replication initiator protein DnaA [Deltaproteobacteria bacterium]